MSLAAPVIALDGPTASGKGTVAVRIARHLGWHMLDSGAIYRLAALAVIKAKVDPVDLARVVELARSLQIRFEEDRVLLSEQDVTQEIRHEDVGNLASRLAPDANFRLALLERQRAFRVAPGLVADGRDMGTVVFPDAPLKIYLLARVQARAQRRFRQLREQGVQVEYDTVLKDLEMRDARDIERAVAPLRPAPDAHVLDSSELTIDQTVNHVLDLWKKYSARPKPSRSPGI